MQCAQHIQQQNILTSPSDVFFEHFDILIPDTVELKKVYKLRHKVFCQQMGYFTNRVAKLEEAIEKDEFDDTATHCMVIHKQTSKVVGCIRLVKPNLQRKLPFSNYIPDYPVDENEREISRLVVCPDFRNKLNDQQISALLCNALFLAVNIIAEHEGVDSAHIFVEKIMARALRQFGFSLRPVTEKVTLELADNKISQRYLYSVDLLRTENLSNFKKYQFMDRIKEALYPDFYPYAAPTFDHGYAQPALAMA